MSSSSMAPRGSLGEAEREAFHATLAFLDEYDGDIDLALPNHDDVDSSSSSDATSWSPAPTTSVSEDGPSQSEPDSEATLSPGGSPAASPLLKPKQLTKKKPTATPMRRHTSSHAEDPRMSAKTAAEGAYPSRTRRAELEYLRGKVGELEERLRVIKHTSRAGDKRVSSEPAQDSTKAKSTASSAAEPWDLALVQHQEDTTGGGESMWEEVAMRQFEQRQQAEIENQRLRSMLESQIKLARGLERLLKRTNADLILPTNQLKRPRLSPDGRADAAAFDDLMGVIDEMYTQMDAVFADQRFDREDAPLRDIQVSHDTSLGTVVDVFDARNLPFELRATSDAVWGYFANTSVSYAHQQVEITDDVIKKHFDFMVELQRYQSHFRGRLAGRRYFEEDRIVILWVAMIEPEMPGGTSSDGMVVRQKGWTIVKRPNALPPNCDPSAPIARIQSKHVAVPYVYEDVPDHKRRTGTLTNFVLQSVYSHLQTSRKIIENVLIEGAMKQDCTSKAAMDDDEIHATMAFLAEFDDAASDDEPQQRRRRLAQAPVVVTTARATVDASTTTQHRKAPAKPHASPTKPTTASTKRSKRSNETVTTAGAPAVVVTETVPLAQPKTRKEELEFMREQVKELEEKLRLLKRGARRDGDDETAQSSLEQHTDQLRGELALVSVQPQQQRKTKRIVSMWEDLAMRQYQQRQRAEVENLKLKSSFEDQLKVAKSLQRMLKRSKCDVLTPRNHAKRIRVLHDKSPAEDAAEFEDLSSTVTSMYGDLDDAFADARFATADVDFRDVIVRQDAATGTTIEVLNAKMVPFDFRTTAAAMWDYFINYSMDAQGFFVERTVERTTDSVMNSVRVELEVKRFCGRFRGKIVGRRYREADRVVIVWAVLAEPVEVSDAPMDGIILRQRGWTIVRKPSATTDLDANNVAMIQTKHVAIPMLYEDDVPDLKRKLELLTNYVVCILFHQIESSQLIVENLLFESLKTSKQDHDVSKDAPLADCLR